MFDHILMFADESSAKSALTALGYARPDREGALQWDASRVIPGVKMVLADAVLDRTNPMNPVVVSPQQVIPGYFVVVSLPAPNEDLKALPNAACRLIASADLAAAGQPFVVWVAADLTTETISSVIRVEPTWSGRNYNFQGG